MSARRPDRHVPQPHPTPHLLPPLLTLTALPRVLQGAVAPRVQRTALQLDFAAFGTADLWAALLTFLYLDFLDATSTVSDEPCGCQQVGAAWLAVRWWAP